jgi:anti-sigma factor RsiW
MLTFALVAALSGAAPPVLVGPAASECRRSGPRTVVERSTSQPRKLDELPPAVAILAVNKSVNGCPVSVLMQTGPDGRRVERMLEDGARKRPVRSSRERGPERQGQR